MNGKQACQVAVLALALAGCGRGSTPSGGGTAADDPAKQGRGAVSDDAVVAEFADQKLTVKDLNDYFQANLYLDDGVDDISPDDLSILKSRLFDSFVDEALLLHEAKQAGIQISPEELEAYMQSTAGEEVEDAKAEAMRREMGRRDLTIQKLRSTWVEATATVSPEEIKKYAAEHHDEFEPQKSLTVRSLMLPSEEQAKTVSASVSSRKMTFDQALETPGANKSQAQPTRVTLDSLPADVRVAIVDLQAGQISKPVMINGRAFVFYVDSWAKPAGDLEATIQERAEAALRRQKQEGASRAQVTGARQRIPTNVHIDQLPFVYIPV